VEAISGAFGWNLLFSSCVYIQGRQQMLWLKKKQKKLKGRTWINIPRGSLSLCEKKRKTEKI
jgi:hypothetical protein